MPGYGWAFAIDSNTYPQRVPSSGTCAEAARGKSEVKHQEDQR